MTVPRLPWCLVIAAGLVLASLAAATEPGQYRLLLDPAMLQSSSELADFSPWVDEQLDLGDPPAGQPASGLRIDSRHHRHYPFACVIDLGELVSLATLWLFDTHNIGTLTVQTGGPDDWNELAQVTTDRYQQWRAVPVDRVTRYLRLELLDPAAILTEIAIDAWSPAGWQRREAELTAARQAAEEREAALVLAREAALRRPVIEREPFGRLSLVDAVDCAAPGDEHGFAEAPAGASQVAELLGRPCRQVTPQPTEAAWISYRLGRGRLLRPGAAYVLELEYPEDAPRSMVVINTGNETSLGFHTGLTVGDALHARYVNSLPESLDLPLSGQWERWTSLFWLHDRFTERGLVRGDKPRPLLPEDGIEVTIACFSAPNDPLSAGPAVARLALYEVLDPAALEVPLALPPEPLPRRRIFWREEMSDGVIAGRDTANRGLTEELDWFRYKANLMRFLGVNTYAKDLLEFGACQHWDSAPHGGNAWVYHDARTKGLWTRIVEVMGEAGFEVVPYYEYSGSKGERGLGNQRRSQPLTRDDAYTHISWVESANADLTDPETLADFCRMLDCTVIAQRELARFPGIWIRTRGQLPVSFAEATRARFAAEANAGRQVSRPELRDDSALYERYLSWWQLRRRDFFVAVRDYLRANGVADAFVIYSGCPAEPGVGFGDWTARLVTDRPEAWGDRLAREEHLVKGQPMSLVTPREVVEQGLYRQGLLSPGLTWGGWEVQHSRPADDPATYAEVDGVMLAHAFNRSYTVLDPATMELFRSPAGLTLVRHHALNEDMLFDAAGQPRLGYFVADVERAGPFCMMAEALAVAHGDPTQLAYLTGANHGRGFPGYVRDFNQNYLALPALPSRRLPPETASDPRVVVREIATAEHGTWLAVVNTGPEPLAAVRLTVPARAHVAPALGGPPLPNPAGAVTVELRPFQLLALHLTPAP